MRNLKTRPLAAVALLLAGAVLASLATAHPPINGKHTDPLDRFYQIEQLLPTPTPTRTASGAPGPQYWQQQADYKIDIRLDDAKQRLEGTATIDYHNRSPHELSYIWIQMDQNRFMHDADGPVTEAAPTINGRVSINAIKTMLAKREFDGGYKIAAVTGAEGEPLPHVIAGTMMRIDLPEPLPAGERVTFSIDYAYNIVDATVIRARGGFEYFEEDDNRLYEIAQWFPRVAAYTDYQGWQHKAFLGRGEFTLELGDYEVSITVPADFVVSATGVLQNPDKVLKPEWIERLDQARTAEKPLFIVTPEEAKANETSCATATKTWTFKADNVRDFAFAASRKFIWDAMGTPIGDRNVMSMSFYPNEGEPLWSKYSTEAVAHTLEVYGKFAFEYPYPVAISVNGPIGGMEYPMICFNGPRPETDGTYSRRTKYGLISVIIHEVGHNFFPMIVNSDERQWTWMDEGLNTFLQYLTEQEWEDGYPSRRGPPENMIGYMKGQNQRPIMTGSEEILQFGANAYAKPATALNVLRETILGRERFDHAFRTFAQRWRFKRPTPADFFRTMEDASGRDLDWFWRGWFYTTDHVDIAITDVELHRITSGDPDEKAERRRREKAEREPGLGEVRNQPLPKRANARPELKDFYNSDDYNEISVTDEERKRFRDMVDKLDPDERALMHKTHNFYVAEFENLGGLVMPIIIRLHYDDSTSEIVHIPAEIWRKESNRVRKLFISDKTIVRFEVDPRRETADADTSNNIYPPQIEAEPFELYKSSRRRRNAMQRAGLGKKKDDDASENDDSDSQETDGDD